MEFERRLVLKEIRSLRQKDLIKDLGTKPSSYYENKDSKKSVAIRKQGNDLFIKKNHDEKIHEEVWKLYTQSIAYAPNESEELAVGFANRSALLLHLQKYNDCLLDIDRALKLTDSNALKVKLHLRQSECYAALQDGKEEASLEKAKILLEKIVDAKERKKLVEMIEKTEISIKSVDDSTSIEQEEKYEISCDNNAFRINYNEKNEKHLVADRDINIGEFLYVEKFYLTSANSTTFYAYCSHCLAISWATIPCDHCSSYMYCSNKCKEEAWQEYHDMECAVEFVKRSDNYLDYIVQLALRAFVKGFKEAGSIAKLKLLTNEIDDCTELEKRSLAVDGNFSSNSFRSLYSLRPSKKIDTVKLFIRDVLYFLVLFVQKTCILGEDFKYTDNTDLMSNENVIFVASLIVRLLAIVIANTFEVTSANLGCTKGKRIHECLLERCCSRGLSLSLFTRLIHHSCDNNVDKFYTNDGRVVYYAVQPIKKDSQIFSSYYCRFFKMDKSYRQIILSRMYEFNCDCVACKNDWPHYLYEHTLSLFGGDFQIYLKHEKLIYALQRKEKQRPSDEFIRSFVQDLEKVFNNSYKRPEYVIEEFIWVLSLLIEHRYFVRLEIPSTCGDNLNK